MSKVKKILAMIVSLAMVLGMSMTTFAADSTEKPYASNITVNGLAAEETTVNAFKAVYLNATDDQWEIANWAKPYIVLSTDKKSYEITDPVALGKAVPTGSPDFVQTSDATTVIFANVPVGAYVLIAAGEKVTYTTMVANTYKADETYMTSTDVAITAKADKYVVDKKADDNFVARGETVTFDVTTTFPNYETPDADGNSYKLIDTPTGLDITSVVSVTIGGASITGITGSLTDKGYVIDLSSQIGADNANAGKAVVVTYQAIVTSDEGYSNTANAYRNDVDLGHDDEEGYTGNITLTKIAEDEATVLDGAEFEVAKKNSEGTLGAALYFIKTAEGTYKLALSAEEADATTTVIATNGTVKLTGLDEGIYHFTETKAPEGYSINAEGRDVEVTENETTNADFEGKMVDTKLSSLPSTGGIGTTIFTIGGCIIMIAAAALFFASRRKNGK